LGRRNASDLRFWTITIWRLGVARESLRVRALLRVRV
jgi:hypothetical protein